MLFTFLFRIAEQPARADDAFYQPRSGMVCHPEHIRSAQCKLREGSLAMGKEMLRCAQHDSTDFGR
jgi:hypothetical protein